MWSVHSTAQPLQTTAQQSAVSDTAELDTVVVEAQKQRELLQRQVSTFVTSITVHSKTDSLARWQVPICPLVAGLPLSKGQYVFDRVSQVASEVGIPLAPEGCNPNFVVVFSREPQKFLETIWANNPRMFNTERGVGGIKRTIQSDAPVRVVYNACSVPPGISNKRFLTSDLNCGVGVTGSRLTWSAVRVIYSVIVVVDREQTKALEIGPVADYVAMISLAQIRRSSDLNPVSTILHLFDETGAERPQGLSTWDHAFLESLYATNSASIAQKSQIKLRMTNELARKAAGPVRVE